MEEIKKHMCKFCYKTFPCGKSLGGHMRSHLITIQSSDDQKLPKKKLPPLTNAKHGLSLPKKTKGFVNADTLLDQERLCKECGKTFRSCKALFGHMKSHAITGKATTISVIEDSLNTSSDNQSGTEAVCRRKRSERTKRYTIDQQEQEEVALSLILLSSTDKGSLGNLGCMDSVIESSGTGFESLEGKQSSRTPRKKVKSCEGFECIESEVNSPKSGFDHFGSDFAKKGEFKCVICRRAFRSFQALGGHRASHKKFKGCCAPTSDQTSLEGESGNLIWSKRDKEHECAICFKVFGSGQALGGHKRSHLINDQPKSNMDPSDRPKSIDPCVRSEESIPRVRGFLDLNLPAPVEEECDELKDWWIGTSYNHQHEPLLGLLSNS